MLIGDIFMDLVKNLYICVEYWMVVVFGFDNIVIVEMVDVVFVVYCDKV